MKTIEARQFFVADRVRELLSDERWFISVSLAYDSDPHVPACLVDYAKAKAKEQAELEWANRMDVLLDADINQELTR